MSGPVSSAVLDDAVTALADAALHSVQTPDRGVRVEDYLCTLAAVAGEATLVSSGIVDIESSPLAPGSAVFGDAVNVVLSGDTLDRPPAESVIGIFTAQLVPAVVPADALPSLEALYRYVAANIGTAPWGTVPTSVADANQPTVMALRAAFEMRSAVELAQARCGLADEQRYVPCVLALCLAIRQTQGAIDIGVAVTLALEVTFAMAKTMPMSRHSFDATANESA